MCGAALRTWPDVTHCWQLAVPGLPAAVVAMDEAVDFVRGRLTADQPARSAR
ncbi:hypothetical protein LRS74_31625 [Streptomyces sp. LX-29]|uniref:hypothetical protein n=1 Tax=Streptomyces sp. LX-29 TaxID=2900152 RepID=UPI00240D4DCB|nr:hypothetical protein [Streptomyces sp. LX-29]WFB11084.1 hypothetical protein LRS74_31625 [Streptomyces sp. LX-29]